MRKFANQIFIMGLATYCMAPDNGAGDGGGTATPAANNDDININVNVSGATPPDGGARMAPPIDEKAILEKDRKRSTEIRAIAQQFDMSKAGEEYVLTGRSLDEFRALVLSQQPKAKPMSGMGAELGLSEKEKRQYSFNRAILALEAKDWRLAPYEKELSDIVANRTGKTPGGFLLPMDIMTRELNVTIPSAGGSLVATNLIATSFIEMLRERIIVRSLGAKTLEGLVGNVDIPRQTGGATGYWLGEGDSPSESQQSFDQVKLTPKTVGAFTDVTRKLLMQSSLSADALVQSDLAQVLALEIDKAAIKGTGSTNQPLGILGTPGVGLITGGANGAAPTFDNMIDLETEIAADNADIGTLAYLTNARVRGKLKKTDVGVDTGQRVWSKGGTKDVGEVNGYNAYVSNQIPSNLTKGTSADICSAIIFGNWADLVLALWGGLEITLDPFSKSTAGTLRVVALQDVDIAVRHAESFAIMLDALTN